MYDKLKALRNFDAQNLDELVALKTFGAGMQAVYAQYEIPEPEWLTDANRGLDLQIRAKHSDWLEAELKKAKLEGQGLATQAERKAANAARIAKLERALGRA